MSRAYKYYEITQRGNLRYRSLTRVAGPLVEPVSVSEAKQHLRLDRDFNDDDAYVQGLITASRFYAETYCDRTFVRSQWRMALDVFPPWDIELPRPPIYPGDTPVVTYIPSNAVYEPIPYDNFRIDRDSTPPCIRPQWNLYWPSARGAENDVIVTWWAGYGNGADSVPQPVKNAMMFMIAHWYGTREAVVQGAMNPVPMAVDLMLGTVSWGQYR